MARATFFDVIDDPSDVVLDYPTTIASPKKYFLPSEETLFKFDVASNDVVDFEIDIKPRVLFGVHPCDLNAIERLDAVFLDSAATAIRIIAPAARPRDRRRGLHAHGELLLPSRRRRRGAARLRFFLQDLGRSLLGFHLFCCRCRNP